MRVITYTLANSEAAALRSPGGASQFIANSYPHRGMVMLADSDFPEMISHSFRLNAGEHLLMFAKDKPTILRGLAQSAGGVQGADAQPQWGYLRGDYGSSLSLSVLGSSLMKQKAVVVGNPNFTRTELRSALEREKLGHRGYFVLLTTSNVLGDPRTLAKFTQLPQGSRSVQLSWLGRHLAGG